MKQSFMPINESWHYVSILIFSAEDFLYPSQKDVYTHEQAVLRCVWMSLFRKKKSADVFSGFWWAEL